MTTGKNETLRCSRGFICLNLVDTNAYFDSFFVTILTFSLYVHKLQKPKYEQSDEVLNIFDNIGPPYWIRYFKFWQSNVRFGFNDPRYLIITDFIQIQTFSIFQVRHIRTTILNFGISDLKKFDLEILRDSEVFFLKNIIGTICSFSPDNEGVKIHVWLTLWPQDDSPLIFQKLLCGFS